MHSSILNPVTSQDVRDVQGTIADLSKEDASAAIGKLSDSELRQIADQVSDFNIFAPGLNREEKQAFFDTMAQKLDGEQLARLTNAFERGSLGSTDDINALGRSIAGHASSDVKLEYVKTIKGSGTLADQSSVIGIHIGGSISQMSDPQAQAIAQVIGSMSNDPAGAEQALGLLSSKELDAVIKASANPTVYSSDGGSSSSYDAAAFQRLMQTAAKTNNADLKALVFNSAANVLKDAESGSILAPIFADTAAMRQGMHDILMSDVNGVITELASGRETSNGTAMAIYSKSAINAGEFEQLGNIQARLALGNDLSGNHEELFNNPDRGYIHAKNAGYFAGAMDAAITSISSDANKQAEIVNAVIGSAATVVGAALPAAGSAGVSVGATASSFVVKAVYDQIVNDKSDAVTKLRDAALPFRSAGVRPNGEHDLEQAASPEGFSRFEDTWNWTKDNAKP